jgi:hypothetical protein
MRSTTTEVSDLKAMVAIRLDETEFLDLLGWTMDDLVYALPDEVFEDNFEELLRACGED